MHVHQKALSFHRTFMYNFQNTNEMGSGLHNRKFGLNMGHKFGSSLG